MTRSYLYDGNPYTRNRGLNIEMGSGSIWRFSMHSCSQQYRGRCSMRGRWLLNHLRSGQRGLLPTCDATERLLGWYHKLHEIRALYGRNIGGLYTG